MTRIPDLLKLGRRFAVGLALVAMITDNGFERSRFSDLRGGGCQPCRDHSNARRLSDGGRRRFGRRGQRLLRRTSSRDQLGRCTRCAR